MPPNGHAVASERTSGIAHLREERLGEVAPRDGERPVPHPDVLHGNRRGDAEPVVPGAEQEVHLRQRRLALRQRSARSTRVSARGQVTGAGEPGERRPEPLHVRRVGALHEEGEAHGALHQPGPEHGGPELVAHVTDPSDEVALGVQLPPGGGHQEEPDVPRVVGEPVTQPLQADVVVEDLARGEHHQSLLGQRKPVPRGEAGGEVERPGRGPGGRGRSRGSW